MIRVGVDVGGTFTDIVLEKSGGRGGQSIFVHKVSSTPADQSIGVVKGVVEIANLLADRKRHPSAKQRRKRQRGFIWLA